MHRPLLLVLSVVTISYQAISFSSMIDTLNLVGVFFLITLKNADVPKIPRKSLV